MTKQYTLIGADGKPFQSNVKGTLGGNRKTHIFGKLDCGFTLKAIERYHYTKDRVFFLDEITARQAGYRPCYFCMRQEYKEWKAKNSQ